MFVVAAKDSVIQFRNHNATSPDSIVIPRTTRNIYLDSALDKKVRKGTKTGRSARKGTREVQLG
ncbi:MAG: hypothetical protein NVS1B11_00520 [Terriglobales bacterium]